MKSCSDPAPGEGGQDSVDDGCYDGVHARCYVGFRAFLAISLVRLKPKHKKYNSTIIETRMSSILPSSASTSTSSYFEATNIVYDNLR